LTKWLPYILIEKYTYILALEMASPGNRHCASCIGTLVSAHFGSLLSRRRHPWTRRLASRVGAGQLLAARGRDCMKQPDDASASFDAQKDDLYAGRGRVMAASAMQDSS